MSPKPSDEHLQDDRGQARAQDLGLGELGAPVEVLLGVEADRDAGAVRPARPDRCCADACEIASIGSCWILVRLL